MTVQIVWLDSALADLDAILDRIERDSPRAALRMARAIRAGVATLLSDHPEAGRIGRMSSTRELVISRTPFVVVYRWHMRPSRVQVLRVVHGRQKWPP